MTKPERRLILVTIYWTAIAIAAASVVVGYPLLMEFVFAPTNKVARESVRQKFDLAQSLFTIRYDRGGLAAEELKRVSKQYGFRCSSTTFGNAQGRFENVPRNAEITMARCTDASEAPMPRGILPGHTELVLFSHDGKLFRSEIRELTFKHPPPH